MKYTLFFMLLLVHTSSYSQTDSSNIFKTVHTFFRGMGDADSVLVASTLSNGAQLQTIVSRVDSNQVKSVNLSTFLSTIASAKPRDLDERYEITAINYNEDLAQVWMDYQFYYKGKYSHYGNNLFVLVRFGKSWKIQYIIDTRNMANKSR